MDELVQIKLEPDIKSEPLDEVDTIEYEQPLNQLDETFAVKVEKIDPDGDEGRVDAPSTYINRFGQLVDNKQPCASHMRTHPNETSEATKSHDGRVFDGTKAQTPAKSNGKSIKKIGKTINRRSISLVQKKQQQCKDCGYVTMDSCNFKRHMLIHSGGKPFPCNSCDKRFTRKGNLQRHLKVHINKDLVHCSSCWQIFATQDEMLVHESTCKRRRYECFFCQAFSSSDISQLKRHMRIHSGVRLFQCTQCSMTFTRKDHLKKHMKTHGRPPKPRCSVCARNFSKVSERNAHEVNCNRRRYECYLCQSYMTCNKHDLQYHMRMKHTGERPFKCNSREKRYAKESHLICHIKRSHRK